MSDDLNICKDCIIKAFNDAENNKSKLNADILNLKGFSGKKTRHLLNNICSNLSSINKLYYLEIGCWYGSTFISALYNNTNMYGIAIDNWSEFNEGDVQQKFKENINTFLSGRNHIRVIENDCFNLNINEIQTSIGNKIKFYMFDGYHEYETHKKAIT